MTMGTPERPVELLLVEDNPGDAQLAREMIKESKFVVNISLTEDGEQAMAFLKRQGEHADAPRPDMILLDMRLPGMDGAQVLEEINQDSGLRGIVVMILTGTEAERSILHSYKIPPSRYFRKPIEVGRFDSAVTQFRAFSREPIRLGEPVRAEETPQQAPKGRRWWWPFG
jgi:two-component system response regulator